MTLRSKMVATISAFCLVLAMLIIGVWAAQSVKVEMGGSLTFDANDVNVKIEGSITGTSEPQTLDTLIFSANEGQSSGDVETWKNKSLTFGRDDDNVFDIVITIKITNLSYENAVNVKILDNYQTIENVDKIITRDETGYTAGTTYSLPKSTTESESTTTFTITFSVADKTKAVSGVQFGYTIDLSDESYVAPSPVVSNDESLGTVSFDDNGDGTTTLIATPKEGAVFVGWKDGDGKYIDINTWDYDTNAMFLSVFNINLDNEIFNKEFADYSFYDSEQMSSQIDAFKQGVESFKETWSEWTYNEALETIKNIETGNFYYTIQNDGNIYTAVFSNNQKSEESENGYTFDYYQDANIAFITDCSITSGEILLPDTISKYTGSQVVGFKPNLLEAGGAMRQEIFQEGNTITKITVPNSFCEISRFAFYQMTSLQEVQIEANINVLKQGTFCDCNSLQKFNIPSSVVYMDSIWWGNANLNLNLNYVGFEDPNNWQAAPSDASQKVIYVDVIEDLSDPIAAASCVKDPTNYKYWKKIA